MTEHNLFYYPYASFTNAQLPLLKVPALWFDRLLILDPVGASWGIIGADHGARDAFRMPKDTGIQDIVTPATVLTKYEKPIAEAIRRDWATPSCLTYATRGPRSGASSARRSSDATMARSTSDARRLHDG